MVKQVMLEFRCPVKVGQLVYLPRGYALSPDGEEVYYLSQVGEVRGVRQPIPWLRWWTARVLVQAVAWQDFAGLPEGAQRG